MKELKPCPFCGGKAKVETKSSIWWIVKCTKCPCEVGRSWFYIKRDAIEAWNRRV